MPAQPEADVLSASRRLAAPRLQHCPRVLSTLKDKDMRLLDARFKYTPSTSTNIVATWKRHGYKPTTEAERMARQRRALAQGVGGEGRSASVTSLESAKRKQQPALRAAGPRIAGAGEQSS
jgi:hypothetical protein